MAHGHASRMLATCALAVGLLLTTPAGSGAQSVYDLAPKPPMGWSSWYGFGWRDNERLVIRTTRMIARSGMKAAGFRYVEVDDGWSARRRDRHGRLQASRSQFPHGIAWLARYVHRQGLKFGLYLDTGPKTCTGLPGSAGHYRQDAKTIASWGVDYVKVDFCGSRPAPAQPIYKQLQQALAATGRPIIMSICEWGYEEPWLWGPGLGSTWRTTGDYFTYGAPRHYWRSLLTIADLNVQLGVAQYARPGAFNDPNQLLIGTDVLKVAEERAQLALWSVMAAPLFAGGDLAKTRRATLSVLTNRDVIDVDQDPAGMQGTRVENAPTHQVWRRNLRDGSQAIVLLNTSSRRSVLQAAPAMLGFTPGHRYTIRDLWTHRSWAASGPISARVRPHDAAMFRVSG